MLSYPCLVLKLLSHVDLFDSNLPEIFIIWSDLI